MELYSSSDIITTAFRPLFLGTIIVHLIADGPALIFIWFWVDAGTPGSISFVLFAFIYPFLYRPVVDYYRLLALEAIEKKDFPKMWKWAGFYRFKWYSKLMFGI